MARFKRVHCKVERTADGEPVAYLLGLPARDMDADEWYALPAELRENALRLGLVEGITAGADKPKPVAEGGG